MELTKAETLKARHEAAWAANAAVGAAVAGHRARKHLRRIAAEANQSDPGADAARNAENEDARTHKAAISAALLDGEQIIRAAGFEPVRAMGASGETILRAAVGQTQVGPDYSGADSNLKAARTAATAARDAIASAMQAWRKSRA